METIVARLTVFFEDPFWVGVYERIEGGEYRVGKIVFGAEPKAREVYEFLQKNWGGLQFSPPIAAAAAEEVRLNPKRMQREISRQREKPWSGTKAQQALKLQQEQRKAERRAGARRRREAEKERQFALRQEKKREKHKGH